MKLTIILILLLLVACPAWAEEIEILNTPTEMVRIQVENDFKLAKAVYDFMPSHKKKIWPIRIYIAHTELKSNGSFIEDKGIQFFYIQTQNSRGIWVHEIIHYFCNQLDSTDAQEFPCILIAQIINGIDAESFKRYMRHDNWTQFNKKDWWNK